MSKLKTPVEKRVLNTEILNFVYFTKILAKNLSKKAKLKDKTQNSRKKLKLREDFSAPERPSDVKIKSLD